MLKFIHITDLHLTGTGEDHLGYDTGAALRRALDHMARVHGDAQFVVVTGDIANWGELAAYRRLETMLDGFPLPVELMIGNHDNRASFLDVFGHRAPYAAPYAHYVRDQFGYRMIFADSTTVGTHGGALTPDRIEWLDAQISESELPVLLFMHHHPVAVHAPSLDAKGLADWPAFHALLRRHPGRIRHILHGHCHMLLQGHVEGISFTGIRSMGPQAWTDLRTDQASRWQAAPHYAVVLVEENTLVTHLNEFDYAGPVFQRERQKFADFIAHCAERGVTVPTLPPVIEPAE